MMSSMISNVESRKTEIGIYMALGINEKDILRMYIYESIILSTAGGILGVMLGISGMVLVKETGLLNTDINIIAVAICFVSAVLCGALFGYIPAKKAATMDPISAIRWE